MKEKDLRGQEPEIVEEDQAPEGAPMEDAACVLTASERGEMGLPQVYGPVQSLLELREGLLTIYRRRSGFSLFGMSGSVGLGKGLFFANVRRSDVYRFETEADFRGRPRAFRLYCMGATMYYLEFGRDEPARLLLEHFLMG